MFDFERPNIEVSEISEDKKYGKFVVEPLERGYGITLGNSLRAAGDVRYPVIISIFSMWGIGTALAWFFAIPLNLGLPGIFAAFFLDEVVRVFLLWRRWKNYHPFH